MLQEASTKQREAELGALKQFVRLKQDSDSVEILRNDPQGSAHGDPAL
jgi:hypothetical protein